VPLADAFLVAMTTAMVEGKRRADTARLRGSLSSCFFSWAPHDFLCACYRAGERIQERGNEVAWKRSKVAF